MSVRDMRKARESEKEKGSQTHFNVEWKFTSHSFISSSLEGKAALVVCEVCDC